MTGTAEHIIRKQIVELSLRTEEGAAAVSETVRVLMRDRVTPVIDEVLTGLSHPSEFARLDRVAIDLGVLSTSELSTALADRVRTCLEETLRRRIDAARGTPTPDGSGSGT